MGLRKISAPFECKFIDKIQNFSLPGIQPLERIRVKITRLEDNADLPLPAYESEGSSGMDIRAHVKDPVLVQPGEIKFLPTGLAISLPTGYEAQIRPRSGLAAKHGLTLLNTPGTIDADYRGEIKLIIINLGDEPFEITNGMRLAQMVLASVVKADLEIAAELDETVRGAGGFGHTGISNHSST